MSPSPTPHSWFPRTAEPWSLRADARDSTWTDRVVGSLCREPPGLCRCKVDDQPPATSSKLESTSSKSRSPQASRHSKGASLMTDHPKPIILVVDDEEAIRSAIGRILSRADYIHYEASDPNTALGLADLY